MGWGREVGGGVERQKSHVHPLPPHQRVYNFKPIPSASLKLLNLNQDHPSKNQFFWSNPHKIEVMITSIMEMLVLPDFGYITTSTI